MKHSYFEFKEFIVHHDLCAMKVGTDGVLLGAWASHSSPETVLDIGTGSGLIALMLAQRYEACRITAVDIDCDACKQALLNAKKSKWGERIEVEQTDILSFASDRKFSMIVCNPPFYENALPSPENKRSVARMEEAMPFALLAERVAELLAPDGEFCAILPYASSEGFIWQCWLNKMHLHRRTDILTKEGKPPKRSLVSFGLKEPDLGTFSHTALTIRDEEGNLTEEYRKLTHSFYL